MSDGPRRVQVGDVVGFRYLINDENDVRVLTTSMVSESANRDTGGEG